MTEPMLTIQLDGVIDSLTTAVRALSQLNGVDVLDTNSTQTKKGRVAEITRDLLFIADSLQLVSGLVRNEYWAVKGYDSRIHLLPSSAAEIDAEVTVNPQFSADHDWRQT